MNKVVQLDNNLLYPRLS